MELLRLDSLDVRDNLSHIKDKVEEYYDDIIETTDDKVKYKREKAKMTASVSFAIEAVELIYNLQHFNADGYAVCFDEDEDNAKLVPVHEK